MQENITMNVPEAEEGFRISDDDKADWAIRVIRENRSELDRIRALADKQVEEIERKVDAAQERCDKQCAFLSAKLNEYFNTVHHSKTKTEEKYRLLSGTLKLKHGGRDYVRDDDALLGWAHSSGHGDFISIIEKPRWKEIKEYLTEDGDHMIDSTTGEIVDGIKVVTKPDSFIVETSD